MRFCSKSCLFVVAFAFLTACGSGSPGDDGGSDDGGDSSSNGHPDVITGGDKAGDGKCGQSENAENSPSDCPAIAGDGFCSTTESAQNAPNDCPSVTGDGVCTGGETPASSPNDCTPINGDGFCSPGETYESAPTDCPPPSFTFTTGSVDTLRAVSSKLVFDVLTINGTLPIQEPNSLTLQARQLIITGAGSIQAVWSTCDYSNAGDVDLSASESITVNGLILLGGKTGQRQTLNSNCQNCNGADGSTLTLSAPNVNITNRVDVSGGWSSQLLLQASSQVIYTGCDGANSGNLIVDASVSFTTSGSDLELDGGMAGSGDPGGDDGAAGVFICTGGVGPQMTEYAAGLNGDLLNADFIPIHPMAMRGHVSGSESTGQPTTSTTRYVNGSDRIEDIFVGKYTGTTAQTFEVTLVGTSGSGDIDIYLLNTAGVDIASGTTPTNSERFIFTAQPNTIYYFAVNASAEIPSTSMDYTLAISNTAGH